MGGDQSDRILELFRHIVAQHADALETKDFLEKEVDARLKNAKTRTP
jgi:hypothetical protein